MSFLLRVCFVLLLVSPLSLSLSSSLALLSLSYALCCLGSPQGFTFHLLLIKLTLDYSGKRGKAEGRDDSEGREQNTRAMRLSYYFLFLH